MERIDIREDLDNQFGWTRIESTFLTTDGIETLTRRFTLNDNGTTVTETFNDSNDFGDVFNMVVLLDAPESEGVAPWQRIERISGLDGDPATVETVFLDNGLVTQTFRNADGTLFSHILFDQPVLEERQFFAYPSFLTSDELFRTDQLVPGVAPWHLFVTNFGEGEQKTRQFITYDNAVIEDRTFENGVLRNIRKDDNSEVWTGTNLHDFEVITEGYDENGVLVNRFTVYDDGTDRVEVYQNGVLREIQQGDNQAPDQDGNAQPWHNVETRFDETGIIEFRRTQYDDGTDRDEIYRNGVLREVFQGDNQAPDQAGNAQPWHSVETRFDETGIIEFRRTQYDDGTDRDEIYRNGVLREVRQGDNLHPDATGNAQPWRSIEDRYDANGVIENRFTQYDDGTERSDFYIDGVLREVRQGDNLHPDATGNAQAWRSIDTRYDENGVIEDRFTQYDDGTERSDFYIDGVLREVRQGDNLRPDATGNAQPWRSIDTRYDENGVIENRFTQYDDGTDRSDFYIDGVLREVRQGDNLHPDATGNARPWRSIDTRYDENGVIEDRFTQYDDGTDRQEQYIDGVLREVLQGDNLGPEQVGNAQPWSRIETRFYESGTMAGRVTYNDDGTVRDEYYSLNGVANIVVQYDGFHFSDTNVHPWHVIETYFDEDGAIRQRVTFYDDGTDRYDFYTDGALSAVHLFDVFSSDDEPNGTHDWDTIKTFYSAEGEISSIEMTFDNGLERLDTYEDGIRRRIEKTDGPEGSSTDTQNWSSHVQVYDASGNLTENNLSYDDGTFISDGYTNGVRTTRVQVDSSSPSAAGLHPWTRIESSFSEIDGSIHERTILYDDLSSTNASYEAGILRTLTHNDGPSGLGQHPWQSLTTTYEDNQIAHQFYYFNDCHQREDQFDNGQRVKTIESFVRNPDSDLPPTVCSFRGSGEPSANPAIRETLYDTSGRVAQIFTRLENGDVTGAFYQDGRISEQQIYDGNDDQTWIALQLFYDSAGQFTHYVDFAEAADLPVDLQVLDTVSVTTFPENTTTYVVSARTFSYPADFATFTEQTLPVIDPFAPDVSVTPPTVEIGTAPDVDDFTSGGAGGITVTGGSGNTIGPDLSEGSTPPSVDVFDGNPAVTAGGGLTLTGAGSSPTPSTFAELPEGVEHAPEIFDFI